MESFIQDYWQGVIAGLALLAALYSTLLAFRTFRLQREHHIKSVKPILQIGQWDYENLLSIDVRNSGTGIAVVKLLTVSNRNNDKKNSIYDWLPSKLADSMHYSEYWTDSKNFVIQPGQIITLLELPVDITSEEQRIQREEIREILKNLTVRIVYEDIYENTMDIKEKALSHFARTDNEKYFFLNPAATKTGTSQK